MPDDAISREAAKEPLSTAIAKAFESNAGNALDYFDEREMFRRDIEEAVLAALDALPAVGAESQREAAMVERPPMLLVTLCKGWFPEWWIRHGEVWRQTSGAETRSRHIYSVDRTASDPEAVKLYDLDMKGT